MIASHIHDAIAQVRRLQDLILEKRHFRGYSGTARIMAGTLALIGAVILASPWVPRTAAAQLVGWCVVLGTALVLNYGALVYWFLTDEGLHRDPHYLKPAIDAVPPLAAGAILSLAAILNGQYQFLFGIWMLNYGLAHFPYRQSLPRENCIVGIYYVVCGAGCLLLPSVSFLNPWPMGVVFFLGELAGGFALGVVRRGEDHE